MQYYSDANAAESWMKEKEPLVVSEDYGHDEASAKVCVINGKLCPSMVMTLHVLIIKRKILTSIK